MLNRRALIGASVLGSVGSIHALAQTSAQASSPAGAAALGPWSSLAISGARSILQVQETGRYLPVLEAAERIRQSVDADPFPLSTAAECFCMIGQERLAALCDDTYNRARRQHMPERRAAARAALADAKATPAIEAIVEHVRDRRIVIINEPHTTARARVFTLALAIRLRAEGFDWFAAETLRPPVAAFRSGVAFSRKMGWWTNEPVFAEVMRHIQALGYRTAAYDYDDPGTIQPADTPANVAARNNLREDGAARHLVENVLRNDPGARVLIHVGYGHGSRDPNGSGLGSTFAARLQARAGVEPFCIDQLMGLPTSTPELDNPVLSEVLAMFEPREPVVVGDPGSGLGGLNPDASYDATVFHPRVDDVSGRPGWRAHMPDVRLVPLDATSAIWRDCRLVLAYRGGETSREAVPSDILALDCADPRPTLVLPAGPYTLKGERADGLIDLGAGVA